MLFWITKFKSLLRAGKTKPSLIPYICRSSITSMHLLSAVIKFSMNIVFLLQTAISSYHVSFLLPFILLATFRESKLLDEIVKLMPHTVTRVLRLVNVNFILCTTHSINLDCGIDWIVILRLKVTVWTNM